MKKKPNISVKPVANKTSRFVTPAMCFTKA